MHAKLYNHRSRGSGEYPCGQTQVEDLLYRCDRANIENGITIQTLLIGK